MDLLYRSTRNNEETAKASEAILRGLAGEGGLYVPEQIPALDKTPRELGKMSYREVAYEVMKRDLTDFTEEELKSCIAGAISKRDGVVCIDKDKCVGCYTCVLVCPYGALRPSGDGPMEKCQLCLDSAAGEPACVRGCPNRAIVFEEKEGA